jgi:hypothetical protein
MLAPEKAQAESGEALSIKRGGDYATLSTIAAAVTTGLTALMHWVAEWAGAPDDDVAVRINTKFVDEMLSPDDIKAMLLAYQGGALSLDSFLTAMQSGGRIAADVDLEDEKEAIRDGALTGGDDDAIQPAV